MQSERDLRDEVKTAYKIAGVRSPRFYIRIRSVLFIDGQNNVIESLRLLHEYREKASAENEDLVRSLCEHDNHGNFIPYGGERPWTE